MHNFPCLHSTERVGAWELLTAGPLLVMLRCKTRQLSVGAAASSSPDRSAVRVSDSGTLCPQEPACSSGRRAAASVPAQQGFREAGDAI